MRQVYVVVGRGRTIIASGAHVPKHKCPADEQHAHHHIAYHHNLLPCEKCVGQIDRGLPYYVKILQLKMADALL